MPSAQTDFALTVDRAAGLTVDALCSARSAGSGPLPTRQRRHLRSAIVALERAQDNFFKARQEPWQPHSENPIEQLELV